MELKKLLHCVSVLETNADLEQDIKGIKISSTKVEDGDMFVCMEGVRDDGNNYIAGIDCGFVVLTQKRPVKQGVIYVLVENVRKAYAQVCAAWFLNPLEGMKFVAVVGTNGKTSTAHYLSSMLTFAGFRTGLIGTEGHYIMGEKVGDSLTTPDPYELHELFFKMRTKGVDVVIAEVSAHAIYLEKLCGVRADLAVLTNITQDHLDFFKDFDNYCGVKMSYFCDEYVGKSVINADDASGMILLTRLEKVGADCVSYGLNNPADCFAVNVEEGIDGVSFVANLNDEIVDVKSRLYGEFNVYNMLAALTVCRELGVEAQTLAAAARKVRSVKGRFSILRCEKGVIIIDYAHTPDGLKNLLSTARTLTKGRLITVFGCGGERDTSKRAKMGEVASQYSDYVVLTSDNPRFENPEEIVRDIERGVTCKEYKSIVERTEAVRFALNEMEEGDTLVIAGKGNEGYLDIRGKRIPYNDFDTVARYGQLR